MDAVGFSLPSTATQLEPRTIVVSLLVGTVVTVVASLVPARRATKVLPVEALREATPGSRPAVEDPDRASAPLFGGAGLGRHPRRVSTPAVAATLTMLGILGLVRLGVLTLMPLAARPLASAIGCTPAAAGRPRRPGPAERDAQPASHRVDGGRP